MINVGISKNTLHSILSSNRKLKNTLLTEILGKVAIITSILKIHINDLLTLKL